MTFPLGIASWQARTVSFREGVKCRVLISKRRHVFDHMKKGGVEGNKHLDANKKGPKKSWYLVN